MTLGVGESSTCTINNDDAAATLTLAKTVTNNNGGTAAITEWILSAAGPTPISGASGDAVSFACEEFVFSLMEIEDFIGHRIPSVQVLGDMLVKPKPPVRVHREKSFQKGQGKKHPQGKTNKRK